MKVTAKNLDGYGSPPIEWERVREAMATDIDQAPGTGGPDRHTAWLSTINADGSPHVTAVGVAQIDGVWYFTSGPAARKARNIAADPRCVVSVATHAFDLTVEGEAIRFTDADELRSVAQTYNAYGWPAKVAGDALTAEFNAPSAGPPPYHVYRIAPVAVYALGTSEPGGATKFEVR